MGDSWRRAQVQRPTPKKERTMKKFRYTDEQIAYVLRQVERGIRVEDACR
jgi:hypothetical protein